MESLQEIDDLLVHITDELNQMNVPRQISEEWKGDSALEEIQSQREKTQ